MSIFIHNGVEYLYKYQLTISVHLGHNDLIGEINVWLDKLRVLESDCFVIENIIGKPVIYFKKKEDLLAFRLAFNI